MSDIHFECFNGQKRDNGGSCDTTQEAVAGEDMSCDQTCHTCHRLPTSPFIGKKIKIEIFAVI